MSAEDDAIEWLRSQRAAGGDTADKATVLLDMIDYAYDMQDRKCNGYDDMRQMLEIAGVLEPGDWDTDPIPLLRLFLPS